MQYTLIKGTFHVVSHSPDADSVKFRAHDGTLWQKIDTDNRAVFERNYAAENGVIMIRLEGIDALETHYAAMNPPAPDDIKALKTLPLTAPLAPQVKQPSRLAMISTHALLAFLGVTDTKWRTFGKSTYISEARIHQGGSSIVVKKKLEDRIPGYVICGDIEANGRPVAFVFIGDPDVPDGAMIPTDELAANLHHSANYHLLQQGMVYPFYYMSLAGKLRRRLSEAAQSAIDAARTTPPLAPDAITNIWQIDASVDGIDLTSLQVITEQKAIYPYLFRKVMKHLHRCNMNHYWDCLRAARTELSDLPLSLDGFFNDANPYVYVMSEGDFVRLSEVVSARGTRLQMHCAPYDLVFLSN
jgi:hypothetical protein